VVAHGVEWSLEFVDSDEWVGDDGKGIVPPGCLIRYTIGDVEDMDILIFYLTWRADNLARSGGPFGFDYDVAPFLNTTDLKALLEDTDSMATGAALAAEMGNTDPLKIIAVPSVS